MDERSSATRLQLDRGVEQAIVGLRKGTHLLKHGARGKQKFCPFRVSTDEKSLIWYTGKEEKQLKLSSVTKIIPGQCTAKFQRHPQPEKECQSFSIIHGNGKASLDLICKDKDQAETWIIGLTALVSRCQNIRHPCNLRNGRGAQSCINSPMAHVQRKQNLGLLDDATDLFQVRSLCGSPRSLAERSFSDGSMYNLNNCRSSEAKLSFSSRIHSPMPHSNGSEYHSRKLRVAHVSNDWSTSSHSVFSSAASCPSLVSKDEYLRDVLMWGEGTEGGALGGRVDLLNTSFDMRFDALLPKLVESASMLDVRSITCGGKHAALVTKQGEVFCWGEEKGGRLGHGIKMDVSYPKVVESLIDVRVESVACGEHHTLALTHSGELYTWGEVIHSIGDDGKCKNPWLPCRVAGPFEGLHITQVACGEWHTAVVSSNGHLFTYGDGTFGALGHGDLQSICQPKEVESLKGLWVKSVACGSWHTASVVDTMTNRFKNDCYCGKLFTWGDGDEGRLGHKDTERKLVPTCVATLMDHDFVQVTCGRKLTVALDVTGIVYTMGSAIHGQLGGSQYGDKTCVSVEGALRGEFVMQIASGSYHVAVLTSTGKVYTWGMGANGRLGLGDVEDRQSPALVEALKERHVQNITCGSSFTAAICLNRSVSTTDQLICSNCRTVFSFTKKKRNCYNCGLVFCHSCTSKKTLNAALAPNKSKHYRVCEPCFKQLNNLVNSGLRLEYESPRPPLVSSRLLSDVRTNRDEAGFSPLQIFTPKLPAHGERKVIGRKNLPAFPSMAPPRWGQITCPAQFNTNSLASSAMVTHSTTDESARMPSSHVPKNDSSDSSQILTEEVKRLQAEVERLKSHCQERTEMLQQYQEKIDETWSIAKDEAAKCKAAKDVIRVLTCRLNDISDKCTSGQEANTFVSTTISERVDAHLPLMTAVCEESLKFDDFKSLFGRIENNHTSEFKIFKQRLKDDVQTPSNTLKGIHRRGMSHGQMKLADETLKPRSDDCLPVNAGFKTEWVEHDEPGVYLTVRMLPCGQKGLKRVRFSRKQFSEKEAEKWWKENQLRIYQKYDIGENISGITDETSGF